MPRLLSPELRVHDVPDPETLEQLVKALNINCKLAGNLRQLCGFNTVGADRADRKEAAGWYRLNDPQKVQYVHHQEKQLIVTVVGTSKDKFKMMRQHEANIAERAFKDLLNGERTLPLDGWVKLIEPPPMVMELNDQDLLPRIIKVSSPAVMPRLFALCMCMRMRMRMRMCICACACACAFACA